VIGMSAAAAGGENEAATRRGIAFFGASEVVSLPAQISVKAEGSGRSDDADV